MWALLNPFACHFQIAQVLCQFLLLKKRTIYNVYVHYVWVRKNIHYQTLPTYLHSVLMYVNHTRACALRLLCIDEQVEHTFLYLLIDQSFLLTYYLCSNSCKRRKQAVYLKSHCFFLAMVITAVDCCICSFCFGSLFSLCLRPGPYDCYSGPFWPLENDVFKPGISSYIHVVSRSFSV